MAAAVNISGTASVTVTAAGSVNGAEDGIDATGTGPETVRLAGSVTGVRNGVYMFGAGPLIVTNNGAPAAGSFLVQGLAGTGVVITGSGAVSLGASGAGGAFLGDITGSGGGHGVYLTSSGVGAAGPINLYMAAGTTVTSTAASSNIDLISTGGSSERRQYEHAGKYI